MPSDGALGQWTASAEQLGDFSVYVHVPFCRVRCGYCDFNTYTSAELGGGASQDSFATTAIREIHFARAALAGSGRPSRPVQTVFFGGGTPTILPAADLVRILDSVRSTWGLARGAEVTTEANPDSVDLEYLQRLAAAGFTRVSFGMQSAVPHVLATLERTHDPARVPLAVQWARQAGLEVSLDLIYGTPGESLADWELSLTTAIDTGVDHISAYALVVEQGTKMAAQVRRGEVTLPSEDDQATKYERADELLSAAGFDWYEVSNWARSNPDGSPGAVCRHNLAYWRGQDWWGIGPGAHSYLSGPLETDQESHPADLTDAVDSADAVDPTDSTDSADSVAPAPAEWAGMRWWNVKHPRRYAAMLEAGHSPGAGLELLTAADAHLERIMLEIRLREGITLDELSKDGRQAVAGHIAAGLLDGQAAIGGTVRLTRTGRLLADRVVRDLAD